MTAHVCVDARLISQSGIGTFLKSTLVALCRQTACQVSLLCNQKEQHLLKPYSPHLIFMKSGIYTFHEQLEYRKKIPRCDLFWAPHFNVPLLPIKAKKRLTTICDVYHLARFSSLTWIQKVYAKLLYNAAFYQSNTIATISEFSRREILKFATVKPKNLVVVAPPIDFAPLQTLEKKEEFLLCVGNLKPHKNLVRLIKAYAKLRPKEKLLIVGKKRGL